MPLQIHIVGREQSLEDAIEKGVKAIQAKALGLAVAYVSIYGAKFIRRLKYNTSISRVRLIADVRDAVSHPTAFRLALNDGWKVRTVNNTNGIFHPKIYVAGEKFLPDGEIKNLKLYVVGSNNLTRGGLVNNVECCAVVKSADAINEASRAFKFLWSRGADLDAQGLDQYEEYFAQQNRTRPVRDLEALGVADQTPGLVDVASEALPVEAASTTWVGLRSSTGGYRFQIEFPKKPGQVFAKIVGDVGKGNKILVQCEDGSVREMTYDYYQNAMYRLNVPNSAPGVAEARTSHKGIALVEKVKSGPAPLRFRIIRNTKEITEVIRRSRALGTFGRTPTRMYGWF